MASAYDAALCPPCGRRARLERFEMCQSTLLQSHHNLVQNLTQIIEQTFRKPDNGRTVRKMGGLFAMVRSPRPACRRSYTCAVQQMQLSEAVTVTPMQVIAVCAPLCLASNC